MALSTSSKDYLKIGDSFINRDCKLSDIAEKVKEPIETLLARILRCNLGSSNIHVFIQISGKIFEIDDWVYDEDHKIKRVMYENFLGNQEAKPNRKPLNGFICLSDEDIHRLTKERVISVRMIWEGETEYIEATQPFDIHQNELLVDHTQIQDWIKYDSTLSNLIIDNALARRIQDSFSGDASLLLQKLDKLEAANSSLQEQVLTLENATSTEEVENKHNLYGIISGLITILAEATPSSYLTSSNKPIITNISERIAQVAARHSMMIYTEASIKKTIQNARKQLESSNKNP